MTKDSVYLIDGNKLKEKAVPLLFPTDMEPCGHLPNPVQAVTVSEIEGMLYREGVELVRCGKCQWWVPDDKWGRPGDGTCYMEGVKARHSCEYCSRGKRSEDNGTE